ncbi:MAG: Fe-S-containing hydro-lyase [Candidatus Cloacimonadales bacterium]
MKKIKLPASPSELESLEIGEKVLLSGTIYTARDAAHQRLVKLLQTGQALPFPLPDSALYYVGPAPTPPGKIIGSAGPTTSYRMDPFTPLLLQNGLKITIGKGQRSKQVRQAMQKYQAVYLVAIGGAAVVIAQAIKQAEIIAYADLGAEAIHKLQVEDFPCIVANDLAGNDLFEIGVNKYKK